MDTNRLIWGFVWGIVATIIMSMLMVTGIVTGVAPMPRPIPEAIVVKTLGGPKPGAVIAHLLYGGVFGALLVAAVRPVTITKGVAFGIALWILMGVVALPLIGWGLFGTGVTPKVAVATLVLHAVYGATLGALADRETMSINSTGSVPG